MIATTKNELLKLGKKSYSKQIVAGNNTRCYACPGCRDCSDCDDCRDCYGCRHCLQCVKCFRCAVCMYCYGCHYCYNCHDLSNKKYMVANVQMTEAEYQKFMQK